MRRKEPPCGGLKKRNVSRKSTPVRPLSAPEVTAAAVLARLRFRAVDRTSWEAAVSRVLRAAARLAWGTR